MKLNKILEINFKDKEIIESSFDFDSEIEINSAKNLAYVIRWQLARNRSGSAKTKDMSEISGTTAKPWKQKGTGRARQGSKRSVQFVGGRTCHGPKQRSFDFSIPKKIVKLALSDSLKLKLMSNQVLIYKDYSENLKTSDLSNFFKKNNINSALILEREGDDKNLSLSARNIKNTKILNSKNLNALDINNYDYLIVESKAFLTNIVGALK